jgi:hypothetical protein
MGTLCGAGTGERGWGGEEVNGHGLRPQRGMKKGSRDTGEVRLDTDAVTQLENPNPFVNLARALAGHNEE